jgi:hypothetical protein
MVEVRDNQILEHRLGSAARLVAPKSWNTEFTFRR